MCWGVILVPLKVAERSSAASYAWVRFFGFSASVKTPGSTNTPTVTGMSPRWMRLSKTMAPRTAKPERLWGAPAIALALGVSVDTVVSLSRKPDCPIYRPSGRYFAYRTELERWLRTKPAA